MVLVLRGFLATSMKDLEHCFEKQLLLFFRTLARLSHVKIDCERASFGERQTRQ